MQVDADHLRESARTSVENADQLSMEHYTECLECEVGAWENDTHSPNDELAASCFAPMKHDWAITAERIMVHYDT